MMAKHDEVINQNNYPVNPNAHTVLRIYHAYEKGKELVLQTEYPFDENGNKNGIVVEYDENSQAISEQVFMRGYAGPLKKLQNI